MGIAKTLYSNLGTFYNEKFREYDLINPCFILETKQRLSWGNYLTVPPFEDYQEYIKWVVDNNQFSLELLGIGYFQFYFQDGTKTLKGKGSATFLPTSGKWGSMFRFDYDENKVTNYFHNTSHAHFGFNCKDFRWPLYEFPFPSEFIKLIVTATNLISSEIPKSDDKYLESLENLKEEYGYHVRMK